jgi:hypothetical protein
MTAPLDESDESIGNGNGHKGDTEGDDEHHAEIEDTGEDKIDHNGDPFFWSLLLWLLRARSLPSFHMIALNRNSLISYEK